MASMFLAAKQHQNKLGSVEALDSGRESREVLERASKCAYSKFSLSAVITNNLKRE